MMSLHAAAKHFDTCPVVDGYTLAALWSCQFSSFNDSNVVGSTSTRRILSMAPDLALPARRVIKIFDDRWLVGDGNPDEWEGTIIRQSFNMKKATDLSAILTPAQACAAAIGTPAYSHKTYLKDTINNLTDSEYDPFWNIFFAPGETIDKGYFVRNGSTLYRVRAKYIPLEDLAIVQCDQLDAGPVSATFETGAIDEVTEIRAAGTVTTPVILLDFVKAYGYQTAADPRAVAGDQAMVVAASALTPTAGMRVTASSVAYRVINTLAQLDGWLLHVRRD